MNRFILLGVAALTLGGAYGVSADVLVMEDGRRIRGELVSVNRGTVLFDEIREGTTRKRRMRINKDEVARIVLREDAADDEDRDTRDDGTFGTGRDDSPDDGRVDDGPFGRNRDRNRGRGPDDPRTDERYPRDRDRDAAGPFGRDRDAERSVDPPDLGGDRGLSSRDRVISVPARQAWTDTGIDLKTGDVVRFSAEGTVLRGPGQEDGPAGELNSPINDRRPVPARPAGALIGRIGTSSADVFFIGDDRGSFRVRTSGRLYLGVNDYTFADNSGSFEVRVSH
jgi:PA-IL-like protein